MSETISAGHLKGIEEALALEAPDLCHHIASIVRGGALPFVSARGQSVFHDYRVDMRAADAQAILTALRAAEKKRGGERKFFGFQLSLLVCAWTSHADRLRSRLE